MSTLRILGRKCYFTQLSLLKPANKDIISRSYAAPRKKFYRNVDILRTEGKFEVTLDNRKLKTPNGNVFRVPSESLARAVATEWDSQKDKIELGTMFLTGLCSAAIDNPGNVTKYQLVDHILKFISTDTVLFFSEEEDELYNLQMKEWLPVINWASKRYEISIKPSHGIQEPEISQQDREAIRRHFLSYDQWSLNGFSYAVDTIKSVLLTLACSERLVGVERAVYLSRLEEEYQCRCWGRVEWAHDADQHQTIARFAAAILFIHLSSASHLSQRKKNARAEEMLMP